MRKLLFLTPELPYPPQSGGKLKSMKLLEALSENFDVTLASPLKLEDTTHRGAFAARSPCREHVHRELHIPRSGINLARSYLARKPLNVYRSFQRELAHDVTALASEHDVIFIDHYEAAAYLPEEFSGTVIYHAHNAYHQIWRRYAQLPGNPLQRLAALVESYRVRSAELRIAQRADLVLAAPNDAELLIAAGVDANRIAHTYHLGDDAQLELPDLTFHGCDMRLLFVGLLAWEANVQGLLWFLKEVWPKLRQAEPDLAFDIVGKNPDPRLLELTSSLTGVRLLGFVEDLDTVYRTARVSVAPLLFGSGMKVKVLDAMARGLPIVTTPVGAEGLDYRNHEHLAVAETADGMASAILHLLHDEQRWDLQQRASRRLIRKRYTWRRLFDAMHTAIDSAISKKRNRADLEIAAAVVMRHA